MRTGVLPVAAPPKSVDPVLAQATKRTRDVASEGVNVSKFRLRVVGISRRDEILPSPYPLESGLLIIGPHDGRDRPTRSPPPIDEVPAQKTRRARRQGHGLAQERRHGVRRHWGAQVMIDKVRHSR